MHQYLVWIIALIVIIIIIAVAFQGNPSGASSSSRAVNGSTVGGTQRNTFNIVATTIPDGFAFIVNGQYRPPLVLRRGVTYNFNFNQPDRHHLFYFTTDAVGDNGGIGKLPGSPEPFAVPTSVTFGTEYPNDFYYQCAIHRNMGAAVRLV